MNSRPQQHQVVDGSRVLKFNGSLLAMSSSYKSGSERWIEFKLYKTEKGSYILSRIGRSLLYHAPSCSFVKKYDLLEIESKSLEKNKIRCAYCNPGGSIPTFYIEKDRYWAQVSETPEAVLESLYKYDFGGARYLTNVAVRLLETASKNDLPIRKAYSVEVIP